jgi:hypothetical protein
MARKFIEGYFDQKKRIFPVFIPTHFLSELVGLHRPYIFTVFYWSVHFSPLISRAYCHPHSSLVLTVSSNYPHCFHLSFSHSEKTCFLYGCGIRTTNLLVTFSTLYPLHYLPYTQRSSEIVWLLYECKYQSHFDLAIFSDLQSVIDRESLSNQGLHHRQQSKTQSASHWPEEKVNCRGKCFS